MLPARLRFPLRTNPEFFTQARRQRLPHLLAFVRQENERASAAQETHATPESPTRFAIIIKKTHGKAVERAQFKRLVRSAVIALHKQQPHLFTLPYAVVLMPLGPVQSQATYEQELTQLLERLAASA